jgi:hypothetical protein
MPVTKTATATRTLYENLGTGIRALVMAHNGNIWTYEAAAAFGKQVDGLIAAALKAALPGRQSAKQVRALQQEARQAFARALARKVAKLPPVAT